MQDKIVIKYNFINNEEINKLFNYFNQSQNITKYRDTFVLDLYDNFLNIKNKFNNFNSNYKIDWWQIVKWPVGSFQNFHIDNTSDSTVLSSITYLNDDFKGGNTMFFDGTEITPYKGKTLFFNGKTFQHSVTTILNNTRYTLACWYKNKI